MYIVVPFHGAVLYIIYVATDILYCLCMYISIYIYIGCSELGCRLTKSQCALITRPSITRKKYDSVIAYSTKV